MFRVFLTFVLFQLLSQDVFNYSNGALPLPWSAPGGANTLTVVSNHVQSSSTTGSNAAALYNTAKAWSAQQWAEAKVGALTDANAVILTIVRGTASSTYYDIAWQGPLSGVTAYVNEVQSGVVTNLGISPTTYTVHVGDRLRAAIVGNTITAYLNSTPLFSINNADITAAGAPGIGIESHGQATNDASISAFYTGQVNINPPTPPPPLGTLVKWHPGYGVQSVLVSSGNSDSSVQSDFALINGDANFNHCHLIIVWSYIETGAQGTYDWSHVDTAKNYCENTLHKRFMLEIWWQTFGVNPSNPTSGTQGPPGYIISNGWYYVSSGTLVADFSNTNVQTAYANLVKAASDHLDADTQFEGFYTAETANLNDQGVGLLASLTKARNLGAFPHTLIFVQDNFAAFPGSQEQSFVAGYTALSMGGGGPDTLNGCDAGGESWGQLTFRGAGTFSSGCPTNTGDAGAYGSIDSRGKNPNSLNRQGQQGSQTYAEMFTYWHAQKVDHVSIAAGNWPTAGTQVDSNGAGILNTTCPSIFSGNCNTN